MPKRLILASRSPRRRELLTAAGYCFEVRPPSDDAEGPLADGVESPAELVRRLAYQKAADVATGVAEGWIVGCDTVAECEGEILGKPRDIAEARRMLAMLSGRRHRVFSGVCVWRRPSDEVEVRVEVTELRMDVLDESLREEYLSSRAWEGKAGAFGYQDRLGWVHVVSGSESNVVGLPLEVLAEMFAKYRDDSSLESGH